MKLLQKNNNHIIYDVGIIGLGNIGMKYDYESIEDIFLTHAKGFYYHSSFKIVWMIDTNDSLLKKAKSKYGNEINYYNSISEIKIFPDILVLSTPPNITRNFFELFKDNKKIKLFILEKPFWNNSMDINKYMHLSNKCIVNYPRKYLPFYQNLKTKIRNQDTGLPHFVNIYYTKGLINNGSHFIDLIFFLFGDNYDKNSIKIIKTVNDFESEDLSVSFSINFNFNGHIFPVTFNCGDERSYSLIELDFVFSRLRIRIHDFENKAEIYKVDNNRLYKNHSSLQIDDELDTNIEKYSLFMCEFVEKLLNHNEFNSSSLLNEDTKFNLIKLIKNRI